MFELVKQLKLFRLRQHGEVCWVGEGFRLPEAFVSDANCFFVKKWVIFDPFSSLFPFSLNFTATPVF